MQINIIIPFPLEHLGFRTKENVLIQNNIAVHSLNLLSYESDGIHNANEPDCRMFENQPRRRGFSRFRVNAMDRGGKIAKYR